MPTYEYMCQACGHRWEAFQRMKDDPLRECPKCAEPQAKRQISAGAGFILKGGGWYSDLYGSAKKGNGDVKSDAPKTGDAANGATKTEKVDKPDTPAKKDPAKGTSAGS